MNSNKILSFLSFTLLLILTTSCNKDYHIEGTSNIFQLDGKKLYIKTNVKGIWTSRDSAEIVHGAFCFRGKADSTELGMLFIGNNAILPFIIEPGSINITLTNSNMYVKGTPLNDSLYTFIKNRNQYKLELSELKREEAKLIMSGLTSPENIEHLNKERETVLTEMQRYCFDFIKKNYGNVLGPNVFVLMCNTMPYPVLTPMLKDVIDHAPESFKNQENVKEYIRMAQENQRFIEDHTHLGQQVP